MPSASSRAGLAERTVAPFSPLAPFGLALLVLGTLAAATGWTPRFDTPHLGATPTVDGAVEAVRAGRRPALVLGNSFLYTALRGQTAADWLHGCTDAYDQVGAVLGANLGFATLGPGLDRLRTIRPVLAIVQLDMFFPAHVDFRTDPDEEQVAEALEHYTRTGPTLDAGLRYVHDATSAGTRVLVVEMPRSATLDTRLSADFAAHRTQDAGVLQAAGARVVQPEGAWPADRFQGDGVHFRANGATEVLAWMCTVVREAAR